MAGQLPTNVLRVIDPIRYKLIVHRKRPEMRKFKHNWRTDMLAVPKGHPDDVEIFKIKPSQVAAYKREKQRQRERPDEQREYQRVRRALNEYLAHSVKYMALSPPWVYQSTRKLYKDSRGKKYDSRIAKLLEKARKSPYSEYSEARRKKKGRKSRSSIRVGKKGKGKRSKSLVLGGKRAKSKKSISEAIEYCAQLAQPKKVHKPPRISRGKRRDIDMHRLEQLGRPKHYTHKYVDNSMKTWKHQHFVPLTALSYMPSQRMFELSVPKLAAFEPPRELGVVEQGALHAKASPRIVEMAVPKARNAITEADYNEDAFKISPNALRYKATERIIELAKPITRK